MDMDMDIYNELKHNVNFMPFNHRFDIKKYKDLIEQIDYSTISTYITSILNIIPEMANTSEKYSNALNKILKEANIPIDELIKLEIALTNHLYILEYKKTLKNSSNIARTIESYFIENQHMQSVCEFVVFLNGELINYLNYYEKNNKYNINKPTILNLTVLQQISAVMQFIYVYKNFYDQCLYDKLEVSINNDTWNARFFEANNNKINYINELRQAKYRFAYMMHVNSNNLLIDSITKDFQNKIKNIRIANITVRNSEIESINIEQASDSVECMSELLKIYPCVIPFYDYVLELPEYKNLIDDFIILYSKFAEILNFSINNTNAKYLNFDIHNLDNIPAKIKIDILKQYLLDSTYISEDTIREFLKIIESEKSVNFFKRPLYRKDGYYYFHFIGENLYINNNIDEWIAHNGFKIEDRGLILENHIKKRAEQVLAKKGFKFYIHNKSKFYTDNKNFEEIDLIIILKNIVMVGECKSIKYPIETIEYDNAKNRLLDGVEQIKRKKQFIENNPHLFSKDGFSIEGKEIVPFVVASIPNFTGLIIDNIPIIDRELFFNYIDTGCLSFGEINQSIITEFARAKYYLDQDSFESNFNAFLHNAFPLIDIDRKISTELTPLISDERIFNSLTPKIYIERFTEINRDLKQKKRV